MLISQLSFPVFHVFRSGTGSNPGATTGSLRPCMFRKKNPSGPLEYIFTLSIKTLRFITRHVRGTRTHHSKIFVVIGSLSLHIRSIYLICFGDGRWRSNRLFDCSGTRTFSDVVLTNNDCTSCCRMKRLPV